MSCEEFMRELEVLLADIPAEEREEALQYYADYFADAGRENEEAVLRDLESPQKTARLIKASLRGVDMEGGEFTEYGYTDERFERRDELTRREPKKEKSARNRYSYQRQNAYHGNTQENPSGQRNKPWTSRWLKVLLVVLIVLCAFPVVIPVGFAAVAVVFALAFSAVAVFAGLAAGAVGIAVAGVVLVCAGISKLVAVPSVALLTAGMGLLVTVIGLIAAAAAVRLCMLIYPALFRFLVGICRKPFHRKAGVSR